MTRSDPKLQGPSFVWHLFAWQIMKEGFYSAIVEACWQWTLAPPRVPCFLEWTNPYFYQRGIVNCESISFPSNKKSAADLALVTSSGSSMPGQPRSSKERKTCEPMHKARNSFQMHAGKCELHLKKTPSTAPDPLS